MNQGSNTYTRTVCSWGGRVVSASSRRLAWEGKVHRQVAGWYARVTARQNVKRCAGGWWETQWFMLWQKKSN